MQDPHLPNNNNNKQMTKTVFVTTGATIPFLALLRQFVSSEVHTLLRGLGFQRLVVQYGPLLEQHDLQLYRQFMAAAAADSSNNNGLEVVAFDLKPNLTSDITDADLVISHAGKKNICAPKKKKKKDWFINFIYFSFDW